MGYRNKIKQHKEYFDTVRKFMKKNYDDEVLITDPHKDYNKIDLDMNTVPITTSNGFILGIPGSGRGYKIKYNTFDYVIKNNKRISEITNSPADHLCKCCNKKFAYKDDEQNMIVCTECKYID